MDKKQISDIYMAYLSNEGYKPTLDQDGDVYFKREGWNYIILIDKNDDKYFRLCLPSIWEIENDEERIRVLKACDAINQKVKVIKAITVGDNVWLAAESFLKEPTDFQDLFPRTVTTLGLCRNVFAEEMTAEKSAPASPSAAK